MLTFSKNKYIVPYSGFMALPVADGCLILSKDDYDDILYVANTVTEMELVDRFGDPCKMLADVLPHSISVLAYLPALLSFDTDELSIEQLIGCCSVILANQRFSSLVHLSPDDFSVLSFSEYILKEYHMPWQHFLDTCIPADEFGKPLDTIPNKYVFLSLYPGQGPLPGMAPPSAHPPVPIPTAIPASAPPKAEWEAFSENPDMEYIGSGAFMSKTTLKMLEISGYDETVEKLIRQRLKELGRGTDRDDGAIGQEASPEPSEADPPAPPVTNPPQESEEIRRALFNRQG